MKKVIKNYLAKLQENDKKGFSLVELIIVMAIMAILVGIVASQVLPYMEKSRQSKDQQQLSGLATDMVSAISQADKAVGDINAANLANATDPNGSNWDTILCQLRSADGSGTGVTLGNIESGIAGKFKSKGADGNVYVSYDSSTGVVCVWTGNSSYASAQDKLKVESE